MDNGIDKTNKPKTAYEARFDALKIAFGPMMFQAARILRNTGILEYLEQYRKEGVTFQQLQDAFSVSEYGLRVLLEAGLGGDLVSCQDDRYYPTKTGYFLIHDELVKVNMDFSHDVCYKGMFYLDKSIETGKPEGLKVFGDWNTIYEGLSSLPDQVQKSWFAFDHYYSDIAFPRMVELVMESRPGTVMDVGGNTGKFAVALTTDNPDVNVIILDHPGQLEKAKANTEQHKVSDRVRFEPMDLLDHTRPFPGGADIIWMSQFLDCFGEDDIIELIRRGGNALAEGGSLYILETYWDKQEWQAASFSLQMTSLYFTAMANGNSRIYHSHDLRRCVEKAGMSIDEEVDGIGIIHTLFKCSKK